MWREFFGGIKIWWMREGSIWIIAYYMTGVWIEGCIVLRYTIHYKWSEVSDVRYRFL